MAKSVVERMNRRAGDALEPGERYIGAQPMTVKGASAVESWSNELDLEASLPNYVAQHGNVEGFGVVDAVVPSAFLAAVTDKRVLVFTRSVNGRPRELVETHDLATMTLDTVDEGTKVRSRVFVFGSPSGKVFVGECGINGKALGSADAFVQAWGNAEGLSQN